MTLQMYKVLWSNLLWYKVPDPYAIPDPYAPYALMSCRRGA